LIKINVRLIATLQKTNSQEVNDVILPDATTVRDLLQKLMIDVLEVCTLSINKKTATFDQVLLDGDNVTIIPPIGGG